MIASVSGDSDSGSCILLKTFPGFNIVWLVIRTIHRKSFLSIALTSREFYDDINSTGIYRINVT